MVLFISDRLLTFSFHISSLHSPYLFHRHWLLVWRVWGAIPAQTRYCPRALRSQLAECMLPLCDKSTFIMNISLNELNQFAIGCFGGDVENDVWHPRRLPEVMWPVYQTEGALVRLHCTGGVRLRFTSDATSLHLSLRFGAAARQIFKGNLIVDKSDKSTFGPDATQAEWSGEIFASAEKRLRLFDIWLPHLCRADVAGLEINENAIIETAPPLALRWLAYGDSITQGMTSQTPTQSHYARCALALDAEVCNVGIGGAKLDAALAETVPDDDFDIISIAYGTNDFNGSVPLEKYFSNTRQLLKALREKHQCPIVLISPLLWVEREEANEQGNTLNDYRTALADLKDEDAEIYLVPGTELVPDEAKYFVDNVHPNDAGFEEYAQNLLPHLRRALNGE